MKKRIEILLLFFALSLCFESLAQDYFKGVHIGTPGKSDSTTVLDLNNQDNLGLLLDSAGPIDINSIKPEGMLYYNNGYLWLSQSSTVPKWNVFSPWIYDGNPLNGTLFPNTGKSGVGIGINTQSPTYNSSVPYNYPANLHVAQNGREIVSGSSMSSAILIGDVGSTSDYMLIDNDEIMVKNASGDAGVLKLQEMNDAGVDIGASNSNSATLNVYGKVKENGGNIQPANTIIMWTGDVATYFPSGLGTGRMEGWALCNGQTHTYNAIDYDTPNLQGQFIMGEGSSGGESFSKGDFGGVDEIYQSENEIGKHEHDKGTLATGNAGSHYHTYNYSIGSNSGSGISDGDAGGGVTTASGGSSTTTANPASSDGDHSHDISGNVANNSYSGSQQAMPNIPPYYVVVYLMKLK